MRKLIFCIVFLTLSFDNLAFAYLGPGMGGGIISVTIGIIVAFFAAIIGILWFPIKKRLKKNNEKKTETKNENKL